VHPDRITRPYSTPYCGITQPREAQRQNPGVCIVVRHTATPGSESMKKALSYEALKTFSVNAANLFWDSVIPKTSQALPIPYEESLLLALQAGAIDPEAFGKALVDEGTPIVDQDIMDAASRISMTPTWVISGIRFPACDFTAAQFSVALDLAQKVRGGDANALERVITAISNGMMGESMW
jgi:hypothetical protein